MPTLVAPRLVDSSIAQHRSSSAKDKPPLPKRQKVENGRATEKSMQTTENSKEMCALTAVNPGECETMDALIAGDGVSGEKEEAMPAVAWQHHSLKVDPTTSEAEEDGVEDEYQLEDHEVVVADYMMKVEVSNFKNAWESMGPDFEHVDEYGLGPRESLGEAVGAIINLLGM